MVRRVVSPGVTPTDAALNGVRGKVNGWRKPGQGRAGQGMTAVEFRRARRTHSLHAGRWRRVKVGTELNPHHNIGDPEENTEPNQEEKLAYRDLREFVKKLEKEGELRRVSAEVDPVLEITEVTDRAVKRRGPALLFERPKGARFPAITNLLGSERRMNLALGGRVARRSGGAHLINIGNAVASGNSRKDENAAEAGGAGALYFRRRRAQRRVPGGWCAPKVFRCPISRSCSAGPRTAWALHHLARW